MSRGGSATSQKSVQDAKKRLQQYLKTLQTKPNEILQDEAIKLAAEIHKQVPYNEGKLEASIRVSVARDKKRPGINASASALSKRGYNYAGIQHENTAFRHPKAGAKARYIADPFNEAIKRIRKRTLEAIDPKKR